LQESTTGTGYSQFYELTTTGASTQVSVLLTDSTPTDVNTLFAKFGGAPSQSIYGEVSSGPATADPSILISSAAPGNWYFLVYSANAPAASSYSIVATGAPVALGAVSPSDFRHGQHFQPDHGRLCRSAHGARGRHGFGRGH
jgi:hypothetical protein